MEGYQTWEILLKLSEPDLAQALSLAQYLGFDMEIMSELLPVGVYTMKTALNDNLSEKN